MVAAIEKKEAEIKVRCTSREKKMLEHLAKIYCDGNLSLWMLHGALNAPRKFLLRGSFAPKRRKSRAQVRRPRPL